jgi:hypothetical protein
MAQRHALDTFFTFLTYCAVRLRLRLEVDLVGHTSRPTPRPCRSPDRIFAVVAIRDTLTPNPLTVVSPGRRERLRG